MAIESFEDFLEVLNPLADEKDKLEYCWNVATNLSTNKSSPKFSESFKEKALSIFVDEEGCPYPDDRVMKMAETMYDFMAENFGQGV